MAEVNQGKKPTCFVIMPISDVHGYESGHFGRVYEHLLKPAISQAGYDVVRADDTNKTDYIVVGIIQNILDSDMIVCDLSARNANVMYEPGIRHAFNKPVVLVKDKITDKVFNIQGLRYTEYDGSLRVDSVQKDTDRIRKAVTETAGADPGNVNSVIQLAGIKAAEPPASRVVSPETQVVLSAIASLEDAIQARKPTGKDVEFFDVRDDKVLFSDRDVGELGDCIYDSSHTEIGEIVDIYPGSKKIVVKGLDGKMVVFSAYSIKSRGITTMPF